MTRRLLSRTLAALIIASAGTALAKDKSHVYPRPPAEGSSASSREPGIREGMAVNLNAVGGAADITGGVGDTFRTGPVLGISVSGEAAKYFEVEGGYQASRHGIDDPAVGDNQALYRHNVNLFAKVGPEVNDWRPFLGAGAGLSYANVTDEADSGGYRNDWFQEIPLGGGLEYEGKMLTAGVRATWTSLFNDEFAEPTGAADNPNSGLLTGLIQVGGKFQ